MKVILVGYIDQKDYINYEKNMPHYVFDSHHSKHMKKYLDFMIENTRHENSILLGSCHDIVFNIFGHYITEGKISKNDVDVILFNEYHDKFIYKYGDNGFIIDFPLGFFDWN